MNPPTYYAVVSVATGKKLYGGMSLDEAAKALTPARMYGQGPTQLAATLDAQAKLPRPRKHKRHLVLGGA
jgi:hypothetical protein